MFKYRKVGGSGPSIKGSDAPDLQMSQSGNQGSLIQHNPNSTPVILSRIIIELCANRNNRTHGLSGRTNLIGSRNDGYFCVGTNKSVPERTAVLYRSWLDMF